MAPRWSRRSAADSSVEWPSAENACRRVVCCAGKCSSQVRTEPQANGPRHFFCSGLGWHGRSALRIRSHGSRHSSRSSCDDQDPSETLDVFDFALERLERRSVRPCVPTVAAVKKLEPEPPRQLQFHFAWNSKSVHNVHFADLLRSTGAAFPPSEAWLYERMQLEWSQPVGLPFWAYAVSPVPQRTTRNPFGKKASGERDTGHEGWSLDDFVKRPEARAAGLTRVEVASPLVPGSAAWDRCWLSACTPARDSR
mmetsp:Transcript_17616/g.45110  ORF Transcript_17616/g.45110 Transcript_17616/m.45110 type:complete len:253 (+) Transcript_17616:798-1556(+)